LEDHFFFDYSKRNLGQAIQKPCLSYATSLFVRVVDDVDTFDPAVWGITMYHFVRGNSQDNTVCSRSLETTHHLPGAAHKVLSSPPSKGFQQSLAWHISPPLGTEPLVTRFCGLDNLPYLAVSSG
jgi:hypothetical protein